MSNNQLRKKHAFLLHFIILIALFFFHVTTKAQKPTPWVKMAQDFGIRHADGQFCYDIIQDDLGHIYFTGQYGLNRYNGHEFFVYRNHSNPKKKYTGIQFYKDYYNGIWLTALKAIYYIRNDSIIEYDIIDSITNISKRGNYSTVYSDRDGLLHLSPISNGHVTIDSSGVVQRVDHHEQHGRNMFILKKLKDGHWFHYTNYGKGIKTGIRLFLTKDDETLKEIGPLDPPLNMGYRKVELVLRQDSSLVLSVGNQEILHISAAGDSLISRRMFPSSILGVFNDSNNELWVGTLKDGIFRMESPESPIKQQIWTGPSAVEIEDIYGGLWFKSEIGNFGRIGNPNYLNYSDQNGYPELQFIRKLIPVNDSILILNSRFRLFSFYNGKVNEIEPPEPNFEFLNLLFDDSSNTLWGHSSRKIYYYRNQKWHPFNTQSNSANLLIKKIGLSSTKSLMFATHYDFRVFNEKDSFDIFKGNVKTGRVNQFFNVNNQQYIGMESGLYTIKDDRLLMTNDIPAEDQEQVDYFFDFNGFTLLQKADSPLTFLTDTGYVAIRDAINLQMRINSYSIQDDTVLWVLSNGNAALGKITVAKNKFSVAYFKTPFELSTKNRVEKMVVMHDTINIASSSGLYRVAIKKLNPVNNHVQTFIKSIYLNYEEEALKSHYELKYNQNNIIIKFDWVMFDYPLIEHQYKLEGLDTNWRTLEFSEVQFTSLDPGNYTFKLRSRKKNYDWSHEIPIAFNIGQPFWQTWWFRLLCLLFLFLFIYVVFKLRLRNVQKREQEKSKVALEIAHLELRALKAQMNPHFIFNSISSVMFYLSQNKNEQAENYLRRFSKLIRHVLESSEQSSTTLAEEINLMRNYISLESERFNGETIQFDTQYENVDPTAVKIAPTLIQPYIENAIRHGLKHKKGMRKITATFKKNDSIIEVTIKDNGIGRKASSERDTRLNHKSFGMLISSRRVELLNQNKIQSVRIEDITDDNGTPKGTKVIFNIPYEK